MIKQVFTYSQILNLHKDTEYKYSYTPISGINPEEVRLFSSDRGIVIYDRLLGTYCGKYSTNMVKFRQYRIDNFNNAVEFTKLYNLPENFNTWDDIKQFFDNPMYKIHTHSDTIEGFPIHVNINVFIDKVMYGAFKYSKYHVDDPHYKFNRYMCFKHDLVPNIDVELLYHLQHYNAVVQQLCADLVPTLINNPKHLKMIRKILNIPNDI